MNLGGWAPLSVACSMMLMILACGGWPGDGEAITDAAGLGASAMQPTRAGEPVALLPVFELDGAGPPPGASGSGLQVLQVSPQGEGRRANQVAVVFDRPMVALTELDTTSASVPVRCEGAAFQGQWAGTSTAVLVPRTADLTLPLATAITCAIPAGTRALDGTPLENEIRWSFETARPGVSHVRPAHESEGVGLDGPVLLRFDQPVAPDALREVLSLRDASGRAVGIVDVQATDDPLALHVQHEPLRPDTAYVLTVGAGLRGLQGPLTSREPHTVRFRTYPPLVLRHAGPEGASDPVAHLQLRFSTPVRQADVAAHLSLEPAPVDAWEPPDALWAQDGYDYVVRLAPRTTYTARLAPGLTDVHGQQLPAREWTFTTGDHEPRLDVPRGFRIYAANNPVVLPFHHLNTSAVDVRLGAIPADRVSAAIATDGVAAAVAGDRPVASLLSGVAVPSRLVPDTQRNVVGVGGLDLGAHLPTGRGLVGWSVSSPDVRDRQGAPVTYEGLALVTDLGATLKLAPGAADVWVTRLSDGRPVERAEVELYRGGRRVAVGSTDAQGLAHLVGQPDASWNRWHRDDAIHAVVRAGDDWTLVRQDWDDGIAPWRFGIWSDWDDDARSAVTHGFLDRGVYRPGDTVHARVTWRVRSSAGLELPPAGTRAQWRLSTPDGAEVTSGEGTLDDRGGLDLQVQLPAEGRLGDYELRVVARGERWEGWEWLAVPARAYRAPAFRVQVDAPPEVVLGREITAAADARYMFGTPLADAEVQWRTWTEPTWFQPRGYDGWSFGPEYAWWADAYEGGGEILESVTARLEGGRHLLRSTLPVGRYEQPVRWFLEAEVTDVDRQAIAQRAEVLAHPAAWYLGLRPGARLPRAGEPATVEVVALDPSGAPRAAQATVRVVRRAHNRVREEGLDGRWRWRHQLVEEPVFEQQVRIGTQPARVAFTPARPGEHAITVEGTDEAGNPVRAADVVFAIGADAVSWELSDDERLELVPEKKRYAPGETARILVKAPRPGLSALVTAERETVLFRQVVTLEGTAAVVEVPITAEHRPNLFVSVVAVTGAGPQEAPDDGRPEVRMGMVELEVDATSEHLAVVVETDQEAYRPRDRVEAVVRVQHEGRPVAGAGVTLFAVDEAVLSLTGYRTPDAHETFYAHRGLGTMTADTRLRVLDRAPWLTKGAPRGGGGGLADAEGHDVRSRFLTTIAWEPDLRTGPDGTVRASFELPDNLTTFRVMAVVDAGAAAFGGGDREIRVTRPLVARPALPRFLRAGDTGFAGVVLHNNTDAALRVRVEATADGPVELSGGEATVQVPAHGAVEVPFRLRATGDGEVTFDFVARAGDARDAVRAVVPVRRDLVYETVASTGATTGSARERIARPDGAVGAFGGLRVDVASTVLVGAESGLAYLADYPHGCVEQITSRALASLEGVELAQAGVLDIDPDVLSARVERVLRDLRDYDHYTGGVTYWPGGAHPSVMGTAYVVELLGRAEERGVAVDRERKDRHVRFLREVLNGRHLEHLTSGLDAAGRLDLDLAARAYVAVALARAGAGDAGHADALYGRRRQLDAFGQASLLEAILRTTGPDHRTRELEQGLLARLTVDAAGASIREDRPWYGSRIWASDDLATAAALEALLHADPAHPMATRLARHLVSARQHGRWLNTRATAGVLAALTRYARLHERGDEPLKARVALAGREIVAGALPRPGNLGVDLPMSDVADGELVFEALNGQQLYYDARMSYVPAELPARDHGFTLLRSVEVLEGGGPDGEIRSGALLRVTLQVATPGQRHAVALVDPLPAGFEPVDASFVTTSSAPRDRGEDPSLPAWGGSWAFDHHEMRDHEVRLYASDMRPGVHVWRYLVRATTPGDFEYPAATVSEMYEPEVFGRTGAGRLVVGQEAPAP